MGRRTTLTDRVGTRLRQDILDRVRPPGALLAEAAVARHMRISRVPVREALFALERDGLVEFSGTGRAYVKTLQPDDYQELFALRLALEPLGARLAAPAIRGDAGRLEACLASTRRAASLRDVTRCDLDFHEAVMEASGNARLARLWRSLRSELELWLAHLQREFEHQTRRTRAVTVAEHERLLRCFREESPAAAERLMRRHIASWGASLPSPPPGSAPVADQAVPKRRGAPT